MQWKALAGCLLLFGLVSSVQADMRMRIDFTWQPAPENQMTPDKFEVTRQVAGGDWTTVCQMPASTPSCMDATVPMGVEVCWRTQAFAADRSVPPGAPTCKTMAQVFSGTTNTTVTVIVAPAGITMPADKSMLKAPKHK